MLKRMIVAGMAAVILIGCGGPPKAEMDKATMAKKKADEAMAEVYAAEAYTAGSTAWKEGEELVKKSEFDKAKAKYVEAAAKFDEAANGAAAGKEAMKAETEKMIADFEAAWGAGEKAMKTAAGKMKGDDKTNFEKMMGDCVTGLGEAKDLLSKDDIKGAKEKIMMCMDNHKAMTEKMAKK
jgi:hypothetical protein